MSCAAPSRASMGQSSSKVTSPTGPQKVLLIGCEQAGKTTLALRLSQAAGISINEDDLKSYRKQIRKEVIRAFNSTLKSIDSDMFKKKEPDRFKHYRIVSEFNEKVTIVPNMVIESMERISECLIFWDAYKQHDCKVNLEYYADHVRTIFRNDYVPTIQDMVHLYRPTSDIREATFQSPTGRTVKIVEIAGSRYARRRWIQSFENFDTIIFVASSVNYSYCPEFEEGVTFFETICNSRLFSHCKINLVFTKTDTLKRNLIDQDLDYRTILNDLRDKYFEVAGQATPVFEVNLLNEKSSEALVKALFNL